MLPAVLHDNGLIWPFSNMSLVLRGLDAVQASAAAMLLRGGECIFIERRFIQSDSQTRYYGVLATITAREEYGADTVKVEIETGTSVAKVVLERDESYPSVTSYKPIVYKLPDNLNILELKSWGRAMASCSEEKHGELLDLKSGMEPQKPLEAVARFLRALQLLFEDESLLPEADLSNLEEKLQGAFISIEKKLVSVEHWRAIEARNFAQMEKFGTKDFMASPSMSETNQDEDLLETEEEKDFNSALEIYTDHPGELIESGRAALWRWNFLREEYEFVKEPDLGKPEAVYTVSEKGLIIGDIDRLHPESSYPAEPNRIVVTPGPYSLYEFQMQFYRRKMIGSSSQQKEAFVDGFECENLYVLLHNDYRTKFKEALLSATEHSPSAVLA